MQQLDTYCDTIFINILINMEFNFSEPEEIISIMALETQILTYQDGQHVDDFQLSRTAKNQMSDLEEAQFWHHVNECKECQEKVSLFIKKRNQPGIKTV